MRVIAFLVAAASLAAAVPLAAQCPDGSPPPCARPARAATSAAPNSVAVLYFENLSRDTGDVYIADGLTEEVTARLGDVQRLAVASRTAVRRLRNAQEMPTPDLGRALNATFLVNGSVRRAGARLRVTVELVRATNGTRVWGEQFDRTEADLLSLQEDIARSVVLGIVGRLLPVERTAIAARPTRNPVAYDHYLRGNRMVALGNYRAIPAAITEYEAALRLDPRFASARGAMAVAYALAVNWASAYLDLAPESLLARGLVAAAQALRDDSLSAGAWLAQGTLLSFARPDMAGAVEAHRRAAALDPENAFAHQWGAVVLRRLGRYDEALAMYHRVLALEPYNAQAVADIGFIAMSRRRYAEAYRWYDSAMTIDSVSWQHPGFRSLVRLHLGDVAGALADARLAARLNTTTNGRLTDARLAMAEAAAGDTAAARARLAPFLADYARGDTIIVRNGFELAMALMAVGDTTRALEVIEHTGPRGAWLWSYLVFPAFDPIRANPRFQRVYEAARPAGARDPW